jgi:hypothetical protein
VRERCASSSTSMIVLISHCQTVLSSVVINHMIAKSTGSTPILCMFLEKKPRYEHTKKNLLGSLLKQLIQITATEVSSNIKNAYIKARRINARPTFVEIKALFKVCHSNCLV